MPSINDLMDSWDEETKYYMEEFMVLEPWDIDTEKLEDSAYKTLRLIEDEQIRLKKENADLKASVDWMKLQIASDSKLLMGISATLFGEIKGVRKDDREEDCMIGSILDAVKKLKEEANEDKSLKDDLANMLLDAGYSKDQQIDANVEKLIEKLKENQYYRNFVYDACEVSVFAEEYLPSVGAKMVTGEDGLWCGIEEA
jgi:hypothetical protein